MYFAQPRDDAKNCLAASRNRLCEVSNPSRSQSKSRRRVELPSNAPWERLNVFMRGSHVLPCKCSRHLKNALSEFGPRDRRREEIAPTRTAAVASHTWIKRQVSS